MNNTSLSSNTKTCPSSSRTHTQLPECSCHHWRPPPGKAVITHMATHETAEATLNHCLQTVLFTIFTHRTLHILITCEQKKIYMYTDLICFYSLLLRVFYKKIVENHKIKKLPPKEWWCRCIVITLCNGSYGFTLKNFYLLNVCFICISPQ